jgi:hypothetical protein
MFSPDADAFVDTWKTSSLKDDLLWWFLFKRSMAFLFSGISIMYFCVFKLQAPDLQRFFKKR